MSSHVSVLPDGFQFLLSEAFQNKQKETHRKCFAEAFQKTKKNLNKKLTPKKTFQQKEEKTLKTHISLMGPHPKGRLFPLPEEAGRRGLGPLGFVGFLVFFRVFLIFFLRFVVFFWGFC